MSSKTTSKVTDEDFDKLLAGLNDMATAFGEDPLPLDPDMQDFLASVDFELSLASGSPPSGETTAPEKTAAEEKAPEDDEDEGAEDEEPDEETQLALKALLGGLDKLEKTFSRDLLEELADWREDVREAVNDNDLEHAQEQFQALKDEIPDATRRLEDQKKADAVFKDFLGTFDFSGTGAVKVGAVKAVDEADLEKLGFGPAPDPTDLADVVERIDNFRKQFRRSFEANCSLLPQLPPVTTPECAFTCSKPVIVLKNPGLCARPSQLSGGGTEYALQAGNFAFHVTVTMTAEPSADAGGWQACLLQNCNSNRRVAYSDGGSLTKTFAMMADILPVWVALSPGKTVPLCLTDAPKWQWNDEPGCKIDTVAIDDTLVVYLLVRKQDDVRCLARLAWSFKSDGKSASYAVTALRTSSVSGDGGAILGVSPRANAQQNVRTSGTAKQ